MPVSHLYVFGKMIFCPFSNWIFFFFCYWVLSSLYILDINPVSDIWFANIFSHLGGSLFILLVASFAVQKIFTFNSYFHTNFKKVVTIYAFINSMWENFHFLNPYGYFKSFLLWRISNICTIENSVMSSYGCNIQFQQLSTSSLSPPVKLFWSNSKHDIFPHKTYILNLQLSLILLSFFFL